MTIEVQFASFFTMFLVGIYLGAMFDTSERLTQALREKVVVSFLFQFIFWLAQSFSIFYVLVKINGGQVRLYFIIAIIIGFWFYFALCRKLFQRFLEKVISLVKWVYNLVAHIIWLLLIKPIIIIGQMLLFLLNIVILTLSKILFIILQPIKWLLSLIWRMIPKNVKKYLVSLAGIYSKIENIISNRRKE